MHPYNTKSTFQTFLNNININNKDIILRKSRNIFKLVNININNKDIILRKSRNIFKQYKYK